MTKTTCSSDLRASYRRLVPISNANTDLHRQTANTGGDKLMLKHENYTVSTVTQYDFRLATIALSLLVVGTVTVTRRTGELFPWLPIFAFVSVLVLLRVSYENSALQSDQLYVVLFLITGLSVAYRLIAFAHPASLVGMDPDRFAAWAHLTQVLGEAAVAEEFYSGAPAHHVLLAEWAMLIGRDTLVATGIFPLAFGLTTVFTAVMFCRYVTDSRTAVIITALLGAILATQVRSAYWPVAQNLGDVYLVIFIYLVLSIPETNLAPRALLLFLFSIGMVYVHKFPIVMAIAVCLTLWIVYQLRLFSTGSRPGNQHRAYLFLTSYLIGLLLFQWTVLTSFVDSGIALITSVRALDPSIHIFSDLFSGASESTGQAEHPVGGAVPNYGPFIVFQMGIFGVIVSMFAGGVTWLYVFLTERHHPRRIDLLVVVAVLSASVVSAGLTGTKVSPERLFWTATIPLVVLLGYGISRAISQSDHGARTVVCTLLVLLLFFQAFSSAALPTYPDTPRYYLNADEVETKEWGYNHVPEQIHTDGYYAHEIVNVSRIDRVDHPDIFAHPDSKYQRYDVHLFDGNLAEQGHQYVLFRSDVHIYRILGEAEELYPYSIYRLTYDPEPELNAQYDRIYTTNDQSLYKHPDDQIHISTPPQQMKRPTGEHNEPPPPEYSASNRLTEVGIQ